MGSSFSRPAGFGITGHRTGYNVLYGDGSARFYGDPGETIVWHLWDDEDGDAISQHWHGSGTRFWKHVMAVNHASFDDYPGAEIGVTGSAGGNNDPEDDSFKGTPWEIWHHFDNGQQIDVF